jgi:hypothetical protein
MSEDDTKNDDVTITELDGTDPVEVRIRVTPKIHTKPDRIGLYSSLHFLIECGGESHLAPMLYHWTQQYGYYGEREGEAWEKVQAHWRAQYHYVVFNIKYALLHKTNWLCGEAAVAQYQDIEWETFFDEVYDHLHELDKRFAERFPTTPQEGSYSRQAWARIEVLRLGFCDIIDTDGRLVETPRGDKLARLITAKKDTRAKEIKQLWSDEEVLKRFALKVNELYPEWKTIKSRAYFCASKEAQDEWLSLMSDRREIKDLVSRFPELTEEVLRRAVDEELKLVDREPYQLTFFHAILELKVQINGDTLSIYDAYVKYEGKPPAPTTLRTFFNHGKALLQQSE